MTPEHSPAEILRQLIWDDGLGGTTEQPWPAFVSSLPDQSMDSICFYDTGADSDGRLMGGGLIEHPLNQTAIRSQDYREGWRKASDIAQFYDDLINEEVTIELITYNVQRIHRLGPVLPAGRDPKTRQTLFTISTSATIEIAGS